MQADGWTALHMAAQNGHTDVVKALLAAGVNVSARRTVRGLVSLVCGCPQRSRCIGLFVWQ
jgi:ankyrin repeat protein